MQNMKRKDNNPTHAKLLPLYQTSTNMRRIVLFTLLASSPLLRTGVLCLQDLSRSYQRSSQYNSSPMARDLLNLASGNPDINAIVALDHGEIIAEHYDPGYEASTRFALWSSTKTWQGLLFGVMEKEGTISMDETLWKVWPKRAVWKQVSDADDRKKITIESLLQMTSGLKTPYRSLVTEALPIQNGRLGGEDFEAALTYNPLVPEDTGKYNYVWAGNLVSYIIQKRTGMTPEEFAADRVFPYLGISTDEVRWNHNSDSISYGLHGLYLTTQAASKLGMLYLQNGMANENVTIIEQTWVDRSFQVGDENAAVSFGYFWWLDSDTVACSRGLWGQRMCIDREKQRVISVSGDNYDETVAWLHQGLNGYPEEQLIKTFFELQDGEGFLPYRVESDQTFATSGCHGAVVLVLPLIMGLAIILDGRSII